MDLASISKYVTICKKPLARPTLFDVFAPVGFAAHQQATPFGKTPD